MKKPLLLVVAILVLAGYIGLQYWARQPGPFRDWVTDATPRPPTPTPFQPRPPTATPTAELQEDMTVGVVEVEKSVSPGLTEDQINSIGLSSIVLLVVLVFIVLPAFMQR